jgi:serine/threonine protein kinase
MEQRREGEREQEGRGRGAARFESPPPNTHTPHLHPLPRPPPHLPPQDLISRLLERKPTKRLGMLSGGATDVMRHKWAWGAGLLGGRFWGVWGWGWGAVWTS